MAITIHIIKNTHNASQFKKWLAIQKLVNSLPTESYPNGNSGISEVVARRLFGGHYLYENAPLNNLLKRATAGDPHTMGRMTLDPSRLTQEQLTLLQKANEPEMLPYTVHASTLFHHNTHKELDHIGSFL